MVNSKYRLYEPIALVTFATGSTETITLTVYRRETWCVAGALLKHEMVPKHRNFTRLRANVHWHYENTPMQHTAIFHGCKSDNFRLKLFDFCQILLKT